MTGQGGGARLFAATRLKGERAGVVSGFREHDFMSVAAAGQIGASYLGLSEGELDERVGRAYSLMSPVCRLCPRGCSAKRIVGQRGACRAGHRPKVASHNLHLGEEPPISGTAGSGTLFLSHCNLSCVYCQNYPISQLGHGAEVTVERLGEMMIGLQERGAHNINWVTPSHEVAHLLDGLARARKKGLTIPIVYNSSGYDAVTALALLDGIVDIYLADMRYAAGEKAFRYSGVRDYPEVNRQAIRGMYRQVGDLVLDHDGIARRGLVIRHLVLPGGLSGTDEILGFVSREISDQTAISLMSQFIPAYRAPQIGPIGRQIHSEEYEAAKRIMVHHGLERGWTQEMD